MYYVLIGKRIGAEKMNRNKKENNKQEICVVTRKRIGNKKKR